MSLGTRIKEARKTKGLSQSDMANMIGVNRVSITQYETDVHSPKIDMIEKIASALGVDTNYLLDGNSKPVKKIPIVGTASCGMPASDVVQDGGFCYYNGEYFNDKLYCLIAYGDSMAPEIDDGDEVICDPDAPLQNGDMVHYTLHGEDAIKIFVKDDEANIIQFIPYNANDDFKTKTVRLDDETAVQSLIMAKVVTVHKKKFNNRSARLKLIGRI